MSSQNQSKENEIYNLLANKSLLIKSIKRLVSDSWNKIIGNLDLKKFNNKLNEKLSLSQRINIALNVYKVIRKYKLKFSIENIYDLVHINPNDIKNYEKIDFGTHKYEIHSIYKILDDKNCIDVDDIINKWRDSQKDFKFDYQEKYYKVLTPIKIRKFQNTIEQTDHLNAPLKVVTKINIDKIRINYEDKKINLGNIFEEKYKNIILNKKKEIKTDIYKFKDSFDYLKLKLKICLLKKRIGKELGKINKFNKDIKRSKFIYDYIFNLGLILIANNIKFDISTVIKWFRNNVFNDLYDKYYYIRYEFGYSIKTPINFSKILLDIYKNIHGNKSKNYISRNNLINNDFNFNKYNLKNIFKNQKNT